MTIILDELRKHFGSEFIAIVPVGSRITCDPAPTNTDEDHLLLLRDNAAFSLMAEFGFKQEGLPHFYTGNDNGGFRSWRRGDVNIITTQERSFFDKFLTATALAKRFNLLEKSDRISLFQAVLYGVRHENLASYCPVGEA